MERAEGRPGAPQYVHVQLQGGAPWGFTLRGGLEHGEPLIVSKVEDGGKAALSRRLQPGDELVNISGTPLYGSRQEALILIKGSYRTLKMIVRRRSVPVLRPHSWHVAKLAESRPDVPTMHSPADAFSLSWPSGCDVSTDRSSSIGSMESLDHPGQAYYEGDPSPVDQGVYHSKRDSAYSSFSASSIASDCALSLRPEEAVSIDSSLQGPCKAPDRHYLTTGAEPSASRHREAWRAPVPPQPPVRRDSLRAAPAGGGDRRQASVSADMLHAKGRWISDTFLCQRDGEVEMVGRGTLAPYPTKDCLSADQYYMLSSHLDRCPAEPLLGESMESDDQPYRDDSMHRVPDSMTAGDNPLLSPLKGHVSHRHSAPEQLLASQLRSLQLGTSSGQASPAPSGHRWTLSPLHPEGSRGGTTGAAQDPPHCPEPCCCAPSCRCCPELQQACGQDGEGASPPLSTEGPVEEESRAGARRSGGPPHRSAQMRRRSDRFATSLRNEIQRRKAQLQKSRGPSAPPPGGEPVEETEEPPEGSVPVEGPPALPECLSPAPSEASRNAGHSGDRGIPTPDPVSAPKGPPSPERVVPTARCRWRWSPERKLQPQHSPSPSELEGYSQGLVARSSPPQGSDEVVLLPFADRRRFFEESSRPAPPRHSKPPAGDPGAFQPPGPEHRAVRRLSVDQPYNPPSPSRPGSAGPYAECCREQPHSYKPLGRPGEQDYLRGFSYPCRVPLRPEPCRYCGGDLCPPPLPRGHTCRCHPVPWVRCPDCCCLAPHPGREESDAWPPRRAFVPEFPQDEWEPPAITRKVSQSISELSTYPLGFPRLGPFHTCLESTEPEWPPCYRATSTHDLLWDSDHRAHTPESPPDPLHRPLRGRAFSESHLNLEPASSWGRDRKDLFRAKLNPPSIPKKKGPPPPRPPPPNWEKYRQRRASQHPPDGAGHGSAFSAAPVPMCSVVEAAREWSQSLTGEQEGQSWGHTARPPAPPGAWPRPEPPRALRRTPGPDAAKAEICRVSGAGEKRMKMKQSWEIEEQPQKLVQNYEQSCASPRAVGECSLSLHCGPGPALPEALKPSPGAVERVSCQDSRPQPRCMDSEELLWDVAVRDRSQASVLAPCPGTTTEVMGELLVAGERQAWQKCLQQDWHLEALTQDRQGFEPISPPPRSAASSSSFPVHYGVAVGKAEPLNKVKVLPEVAEGSSEDEEEEVDHELVEKKLQLIESLSRKLVVLQEAQRGLQDDISANGALGEDVAARLQALCTPGEFDKYRLFVGDLDKVVNLLLSLSGRLARVETALGSLGPHARAEDELALREKQRLLVAQLEDAKELKEHVGRREEAVGAMVARYLPAEHLQDYQHFVKMKSALIAEQRELEEKIKLGQEQLSSLRYGEAVSNAFAGDSSARRSHGAVRAARARGSAGAAAAAGRRQSSCAARARRSQICPMISHMLQLGKDEDMSAQRAKPCIGKEQESPPCPWAGTAQPMKKGGMRDSASMKSPAQQQECAHAVRVFTPAAVPAVPAWAGSALVCARALPCPRGCRTRMRAAARGCPPCPHARGRAWAARAAQQRPPRRAGRGLRQGQGRGRLRRHVPAGPGGLRTASGGRRKSDLAPAAAAAARVAQGVCGAGGAPPSPAWACCGMLGGDRAPGSPEAGGGSASRERGSQQCCPCSPRLLCPSSLPATLVAARRGHRGCRQPRGRERARRSRPAVDAWGPARRRGLPSATHSPGTAALQPSRLARPGLSQEAAEL